MQSNSPTPRQNQLATLLADEICKQLSFEFEFSGHHYKSISSNVKTLIEQECQQALNHFSLSKTQQNILDRADLKQLCSKIAGTLTRDLNGFNITTGSGFTTTGLCKVYFNALICNMFELVNDLVFGTGLLNKKAPELGYEEYNGRKYTHATLDELKNDGKRNTEQRKKTILSALGEELLLLASPEECKKLTEALKNKGNRFINTLRKPYGISSILVTEKNTYKYVSYSSKLFVLDTTYNLLVKFIAHISTADLGTTLSTNFSTLFNNSEHHRFANSLPRVNKAMEKAQKNEIEAAKKTFGR